MALPVESISKCLSGIHIFLCGTALLDFFYRHPYLNITFSFRKPMIYGKLRGIFELKTHFRHPLSQNLNPQIQQIKIITNGAFDIVSFKNNISGFRDNHVFQT